MNKLMIVAAVAVLFAASTTLGHAQTTDEIARQMADDAQANAAAAQQDASDASSEVHGLAARLAVLEELLDGGPLPPPTVVATVDCDALPDPETIQGALDAGATDLTVTGTCNEEINITQDGTTLTADPAGATIVCSSCGYAIIQVAGATNVRITGFDINTEFVGPAVVGIGIYNGAAVLVDDSLIHHVSGRGVELGFGSYLRLRRSTVSDNGEGISIFNSSTASLRGVTVGPNTGNGISLFRASSVELRVQIGRDTLVNGNGAIGVFVARSSALRTRSGTEISNNGDDGILLHESASAFLEGTIVNGNEDGIVVRNASGLKLRGSSQVDNNTDRGIDVNGTSSVVVEQGTTVSNNTGRGIMVNGGSSATLRDATVSGNLRGIMAFNGSALSIEDSTIQNNTQPGIRALAGSTIYVAGDTVVTGNNAGGPDVAISGSSSAEFDLPSSGSDIGNVNLFRISHAIMLGGNFSGDINASAGSVVTFAPSSEGGPATVAGGINCSSSSSAALASDAFAFEDPTVADSIALTGSTNCVTLLGQLAP